MCRTATLEIHNKTSKTFELSAQESDLKQIKPGEELFLFVHNYEAYPITVCKLNKLGNLIATPTEYECLFISFKSKDQDQDQIVSEVVGVYTSGRSNYHAIIAESSSELKKIALDMFDQTDNDVIDYWYSIDENGECTSLETFTDNSSNQIDSNDGIAISMITIP